MKLSTRPGDDAPGCCHAEPVSAHADVASTPAVTAVPDAMRYVCPMCPGVGSAVAGACPHCGMSLEPAVPAPANADDPELADLRQRFAIALLLTLPLFGYAMTAMLGWIAMPAAGGAGAWLQFALATPVVGWCGWPLLERGARSIATRRLNMFTLICLGVLLAYGYSAMATIAPQLVPHEFRHGGAPALYFESAAMIVTLVLLGQVLEMRARARTGAALRSLMDLAPATARRLADDGTEQQVPLRDVQVGDRLRTWPGERVPVDGEVIEGRSAVDESMLTGEAMPVDKGPGDPLTGGTLNGHGSLVLRASRVGADGAVARIVRAVAEAQCSRAPVQALADRVSAWFVPAVVLVALLAAGAWATLGPEPRLAHALVIAVSTLIVACPCALGLATPMSITVALGRGAQAGVLFRDAAALEALDRVDTVVLDKTGTLTQGQPEVATVIPVDGVPEAELLRYAASLEQASEHPLAAAIVRRAQSAGLRLGRSYGFEARPGAGASGVVQLRQVLVGSARLMADHGIDVGALEREADRLRELGQSTVFVAIDGLPIGVIGIADPLKSDGWETVQALKRMGLAVVLLSGDHAASVRTVAGLVGIDTFHAEVMPQGKAEVVRRLREGGACVAMVGDGINDAPALAAADVGIAMGSGTDVARQVAGVTLIGAGLSGLLRAFRLAEAASSNVRQNLLLAFGYNAIAVPVAAGVLFPWTGLVLAPALAAAAMSLSSVSVIGNALRLGRTPL